MVFASAVVTALVAGCTPVVATPPAAPPATPSTTPRSTSGTRDYRRLESEVFAELNAARTNPAGYAANVAELLSRFNGTLLQRPGWPVPVRTQEGASAVREAVTALHAQAPVPALQLSSALSMAARDLATDQSRTGQTGHTGSDGSTPTSRVARYGSWSVSYAENVDYGAFVNGRDVVVDLIVDDGVPDRGHRRNIFEASARIVGIACGPHPKFGAMCVIDEAGGFTPK